MASSSRSHDDELAIFEEMEKMKNKSVPCPNSKVYVLLDRRWGFVQHFALLIVGSWA